MAQQFDTIILGAGAAGCILARGLADAGQGDVLLLESGTDGKEPRFVESGIENLFAPKTILANSFSLKK